MHRRLEGEVHVVLLEQHDGLFDEQLALVQAQGAGRAEECR